ncbi:MAG: serine/threonine protein kinase, partial [Pirellulales bacterium]|nr:serine/threonine protein kinase [Pirellulales bacterium]
PASFAAGYELTDLLGVGAGGMVFKARQSTLERDVALKTIKIQSQPNVASESRIQREARSIALLKHPNIVAVYDSGFHQGRFCIAMELVVGENLFDFISRLGPLPEYVTWQIARQVAGALCHASEFGIIHRDIKPANLLLTDAPAGMGMEQGVPFVKVADFGLALQSEDPDASHLTAVGATLGTPAYVAPEQLHDTHVDRRADIFPWAQRSFICLSAKPLSPIARQ